MAIVQPSFSPAFPDMHDGAVYRVGSAGHLGVDRIVCLYENQPLSNSSTHAVPRLLAQLVESLAAFYPSVECRVICPGDSAVSGAVSVTAKPSRLARVRSRLLGSRIARKLLGPQSLESTSAYQVGRAGLMRLLTDETDKRTMVITATMTATILARRVVPDSRIVYWVQGMPRLGQESLASRAVDAADAIVAPSQALYRDLFDLICRNRFAPPVWAIPNTIDTSQFRPLPSAIIDVARKRLGISDGETAIVHIGRAPEKGLQVVASALGLGQIEKDVVLVSVGGTRQAERRLHQHARMLEVGRVTPAQLNEIYQACDMGVVPSVWWENCPLALIEMMSLGLCPIGSRVGGIPEMIDHGTSGLIVDAANDANAWASAINRIVTDCALRDRMGAEARRLALVRFSHHAVLSQWQQVFGSLMQAS